MKKYLFLLVALGTIGLTTYFSLLPLNGNSQADISNLYATSITPAGFTFSIWSIIYLSWIILGYFLIGRKSKHQLPVSFPLAVGLTAVWLIPWHFEYIASSFIVMLLILALLLQAFLQQKYFRVKQFTLELTLGWILVATIANFHVLLVAYNVYFFPVLFTALSIVAGTLLNIYFLRYYQAFIPALVFIWALFGIIQQQEIALTQNIALGSIFILLVAISLTYKREFKTFFTGKKK